MFLNQGTRQPEASQQEVNGDMASEWEELVELDDVQLATVVGGGRLPGSMAAVSSTRTSDGGRSRVGERRGGWALIGKNHF
jgi:hypothetical protein